MAAIEMDFDANATTRPLPEVREAVVEAMDANLGNPSSTHQGGERARAYLREAREAIGRLIGASPEQVILTSGGTEANNTVLFSAHALARGDAPRILTTEIEHSSVLKACEALESSDAHVRYLPVDADGIVDLEALDEALHTTPGPHLVSVQWVNNETGVIQPIERIGELCAKKEGAFFHTDAAQAVGKLPVDVSALPIDFLTFTGHKLHGPQGTGALYARDPKYLYPRLFGGDQEGGRRAGTENVPGFVGLGKAAALRLERFDAVAAHCAALRDAFERKLFAAIDGLRINGNPDHRVPNTTDLLFPEVDGQALLLRLDQAGIRCSQSSACTNQRPEPSYVLRAMGLSEDEAYASIRFSFSEQNTHEEIDRAVATITELHSELSELTAALRA